MLRKLKNFIWQNILMPKNKLQEAWKTRETVWQLCERERYFAKFFEEAKAKEWHEMHVWKNRVVIVIALIFAIVFAKGLFAYAIPKVFAGRFVIFTLQFAFFVVAIGTCLAIIRSKLDQNQKALIGAANEAKKRLMDMRKAEANAQAAARKHGTGGEKDEAFVESYIRGARVRHAERSKSPQHVTR